MRGDGDYRRHCYADHYVDSFHDPLLTSGETMSPLLESLVQQGIELGPNLIFLGAGDMAIGAFLQLFHFGSWSFWLMVIEIVVAPSSGIGIALGILDRHIGTIEGSGEIAPARRLGSRTIGVLRRQRKLQFLEQGCPLRKFIRPLVYLV